MLLVFAAVTALTGCSANIRNDELAEKARGLEGSEISILYCGDWVTGSEKHLAEAFEAETGIHVVFVKEDDTAGYPEHVMDRLASGTCEDIFMLQSGPAISQTYRIQEYAADLSHEDWAPVYNSFSASQSMVDDILYGMTYYDTTTDYYLVYNKKLAEEAGVEGVPSDWDSFMDMCEALKASGVTPIYEPMADGWHQTMLWADMGQIFEKVRPGITVKLKNNMKTFAGDVYMQQALGQLKQLADNGYFGDNYLEYTYDQAAASLASGEFCMCMLKPGAISAIVSDDMNKRFSVEDFGLMLLPICDNQILNIHPAGPTRYVRKDSRNAAAARLYLSYLAEKDSIQYMIDNEPFIEDLPFNVGQRPDYSSATGEFLGRFDEASSGMVLQDSVIYLNEQWGDISADMASMFMGEMSEYDVLKNIDERRAAIAKSVRDPNWTAKGE